MTFLIDYDVMTWKHFLQYKPLCRKTPSRFPHKGPVMQGFDVGLVTLINSLTPGESELNFRYAIFKWILVIDGWGISCKTALIWMSLDLTDDQSTLVHVMAWCCQATSHHLSQCWPRSLSPYGDEKLRILIKISLKFVPKGPIDNNPALL